MQPVDALWETLYRLRAQGMLGGALLMRRLVNRKQIRLQVYARRAAGI